MRNIIVGWQRVLSTALLAAGLLIGGGCEESDDFDHDTPAGQGTLVVDNNGSRDIDIYIDGARVEDVSDGNWQPIDLFPGVYRVVLVEENTERAFGGDVDVLAGRRTIMDVSSDGFDPDNLQVNIYID
jgi:hypothetical protein